MKQIYVHTYVHTYIHSQITKFNSSMEDILKEGEEFLEDIELAEGNVQQAYHEYRDQVYEEGEQDDLTLRWQLLADSVLE